MITLGALYGRSPMDRWRRASGYSAHDCLEL